MNNYNQTVSASSRRAIDQVARDDEVSKRKACDELIQVGFAIWSIKKKYTSLYHHVMELLSDHRIYYSRMNLREKGCEECNNGVTGLTEIGDDQGEFF